MKGTTVGLVVAGERADGYPGAALAKARSGVAFGQRLRKLRLAKGLSQRQLAEPKYTHAYVSTIEAGRRNPSPGVLAHFASKLGIDVEELTSGRPPGLTEELRTALHEARVAASDGRLDEAREALGAVASGARRFGITRLQAQAAEIEGLILERLGKSEEGLERYGEAERLIAAEMPSVRANAVAGKARCLQALGEVSHAVFVLDALEREIAREPHPDVSALEQVHGSLLDACIDAGLLRKAAEHAAALRAIAHRVRDPIREGQMHLHLAHLDVIEGRPDDAEQALNASADAYARSGLKTETGYARLALGFVRSRRGDLDGAMAVLEEARRIFAETNDLKDLTRTLNEIARVEHGRGNPDHAVELLLESIGLLKDGDTPILAWAERELGTVYASSDALLAEKHLRTAAELFDRTDEPVEAAITYRVLGDVLRDSGRPDAAFHAYRDGISRIEAEPVA